MSFSNYWLIINERISRVNSLEELTRKKLRVNINSTGLGYKVKNNHLTKHKYNTRLNFFEDKNGRDAYIGN
ncbi:hypothetical protein [Vibrio alginolyticus]|uniref:hypothetical protein n=1 Tax=Vibrio alginolyticus TaxID=663 RepID=UPI00301C9081